MKFFAQSFLYDDPWSIVSLAYFLRYPNPYASHILSTDVVSREITTAGTLLTTRLILKRGVLPRWAPRGIISRTESWVIEESEVDPLGKTLRCRTRNLEFTKVMQVEESVTFKQTADGLTLQNTEARIVSRFGWGLTKRIEHFGLTRAQSHMQRSRDGISHIMAMLRESRLQPIGLGAGPVGPVVAKQEHSTHNEGEKTDKTQTGSWKKLRSWIFPR